MLIVGCFQIKDTANIGTGIAIVIPARLASKRLPNKALLEIAGLPMIEHVRRRGMMNKYSVPVYIASGDDEIAAAVKKYGGQFIRTFENHTDGLSRVNEAATKLDSQYYIVLQGDEILTIPSEIDRVIEAISNSPDVGVWNQVASLSHPDEINDVSVVKCLINSSRDIYSIFRKSPLVCEIETQMTLVSKICGLFAVSSQALYDICRYENGVHQIAESIEQLKFIEYGFSIRSIATDFNFPSINILADIEKVQEALVSSTKQSRILNDVINFTI